MEEKKFCKFCGEQIDKNSIVCPKCGRQLELFSSELNNPQPEINQPQVTQGVQEKPKFYAQEWFMWLMLIICAPIGILLMFKFNKKLSMKVKIIITIIFSILFILFNFVTENNDKGNEPIENNNSNVEVDDKKEEDKGSNSKTSYSFDETFEFNDLEITIGSNYSFTKVDNQFSEHHKKEVVKLPITVKNIKEETHSLNMFYYNIFAPSGIETENVWAYFDDCVESAGELRNGASYTKYIYFLYNGDGKYAIEFDAIWEEKTVEIEIKK